MIGSSPDPPESFEATVGATDTDATFDHAPAPLATPGTVGASLSIIAVDDGSSGTVDAHADTLPALSMARNCTHVLPVLATVYELPDATADQLPSLTLVRYW